MHFVAIATILYMYCPRDCMCGRAESPRICEVARHCWLCGVECQSGNTHTTRIPTTTTAPRNHTSPKVKHIIRIARANQQFAARTVIPHCTYILVVYVAFGKVTVTNGCFPNAPRTCFIRLQDFYVRAAKCNTQHIVVIAVTLITLALLVHRAVVENVLLKLLLNTLWATCLIYFIYSTAPTHQLLGAMITNI